MPTVTQRIDAYLGGVSRQSDDKKLPGQVRECLNGYPDPTFGLTKRPGLKWIGNLGTGTVYDSSKWFFIKRDDNAKYVGCITPTASGNPGQIKIWNAGTFAECTVNDDTIPITEATSNPQNGTSGATDKTNLATTTNGSGSGMTVNVTAESGVVKTVKVCYPGSGYAAGNTITIAAAVAGTNTNVVATIDSVPASHYLSGSRKNYDILTVQDSSIITNNLVLTDVQASPTFVENTKGTLVLQGSPLSVDYEIKIKIGSTTHTVTYNASATDTYDGVLTGLKTAIENLNSSITGDLTCTVYDSSLNIEYKVSGTLTAFTLSAKGGIANDRVRSFQDSVNNLTELPYQSHEGHTVKIVNTAINLEDTYFSKFRAYTNGKDGYWEETIDPSVSPGMKVETMPHELIDQPGIANTFSFRQGTWVDRLVGDDKTNTHPSFNAKKIQQVFFYNNRLGFLSDDRVILSQAGEPFNFYHISAQAITDADPIDLIASTTKPAFLHGVLPTTQGLVLFSKNQQFLMAAHDAVLTPTSTTIETIANYEMDDEVTPVDMGTNINFISKTPSYTRVFGMVTRGQNENPQVLDIGKIITEWIPHTIDTFIASPQNQFIALSGQTDSKVYFYRTYSDGEKNILEAWYNWQLAGTVQSMSVDSDDMYLVTKQGSQFTLSKANLSQSPDDAIIVSNDGQKVNPCIDLYATATSVKYKGITEIAVTNEGTGYVQSSPPAVTITGTTGSSPSTPGSGATATAVVSAAGKVTSILINSCGKSYTNGAAVTIAAPSSGTTALATATVYDGSQCFIPYNDVTSLTPILIVSGSTATGQFIESGFTTTPERSSNESGTYYLVPRKNLESVASDVIVGFKYDLDVILPKTYFRLDPQNRETDFTAALVIARMKFAVGLSGIMGFKLKSTGVRQGSRLYTGDGVTTDFPFVDEDIDFIDTDQIKVKIDDIVTTGFTVVTSTTMPTKIVLDSVRQKTWAAGTVSSGQTVFPFTFDYQDSTDLKMKIDDVLTTDFIVSGDKEITYTGSTTLGGSHKVQVYPANKILIYLDEWYDVKPTPNANTYLANDVPLSGQSVFSLPVHQRTENFQVRVFNDSPFPVSLNSMMWEGNYTPRFYRRK